MKKVVLNDMKTVNLMLIGGACNPYKIRFYNILNRNKDYEKSSFKTRIFSWSFTMYWRNFI